MFLSSQKPNNCTDIRNIADSVIALYLLHLRYKVDFNKLDHSKLLNYLKDLETSDGSFGMVPDSEQHGGAIFLYLSTVTLLGRIFGIKYTPPLRLLYHLVSLQEILLSGRPNKPACLCYCIWVYGSLAMLGQ